MPVRININGVGTVEVGDEFDKMTPDQQNGVIAHIVEQTKKGAVSGLPTKQEEPSMLADVGRSIGMAVPFNDRMVAGLKSLPGIGNGQDYSANLANERAANQDLIHRHPFLAGTGQAVGSLALPVASAGVAANGASLAARAALGAGTGAAMGSVYGASSAPDFTNAGDTAKHVAIGTGVGGLLGGGVPILAQGIGAAYRGVRGLLAGGADGMSRAATGHMAGAVSADGAPAVTSELSRLGDQAMLADAGPALLGKLQGASLNSDEGRTIASNLLAARNRGANQRIQSTVDRELGPAESPQSATNNILATRSEKDAANYPAALDNAPPVDISGPVSSLASMIERNKDTTGGKALANLKNMLTETAPDGKLVLKTDANNLHRVKQEIDNVINYDAPGLGVPAGSLRNVQGILKMIRSQLNGALEQQVPGYTEANAASAALARRAEAVKEGTSVLDSGKTAMWPGDLSQKYAGMEPGERAAFAKGARAEIERNLDTKANDLVAGKNVIKGEGDWNRDRLATVFGQGPTDKLINTLDAEGKFRDTYNKVVENSQTAQRTAAARAMKPEPSSETPFFGPSSTVSGMGVTALKKGVGLLANQFRGDPTRAYGEVADLLTRQGSERDATLAAIMDYLERQRMFARQGDIAGRVAAPVALGLLGNEVRRRAGQ